MFIFIGVEVKLATLNQPEKSHVYITSDDQTLLDSLQTQLQTRKEVQDGIYQLEFQLVKAESLDDYLASKKPSILANSNNGLFFVPGSAVNAKEMRYYSANIGNQILRGAIGDSVNRTLNLRHFSGLNVEPEDIAYAVKGVEIKGFTLSKQGQQQSSPANTFVGIGMGVLMFMSTMGIVMPFAAMIIEEKSNRAVEVLLTSVSPQELLAGKIIARTITGLVQMLVWLLPVFLFVLFPAMMMLPPQFQLDIRGGMLLFFFINYVLGLTTMLSVWGGFAAMFDSAQDANQSMWPVTVLMMLPFYTVFAVVGNPANSVAQILSITPLTSLYVMPVRLAVLEIPLWQPLLALALNALVCWLAITAGGKIYRLSILVTGSQPSMKQFIGWLRSA
jgi:ABC-2 type transport system permease protein